MAYTYAYPTRRRSLAKLIRLTAGFLVLLAVFVYMVRLLEEGDRLYEGGYSAELVDEAPAAACTAQCSFNGLCGADGACSCDAGFAGPECSAVAPCLCGPLPEPPEPLQNFFARFDAERHAAVHAAQVEADLAPWSLGNISAELVDRAEDLGDARFQIIQNRLYAHGRLDPPRIRAVTAMLLALLRRVKMPDVDFVVSASDLPAVPRHVPIPVFSAVKSDAHSDILIPDGRAFTEEWAAMVGEYPGEPAWSEKHGRLLWRGSPPGGWSGVEVAASAPEREHVPRARLMKIAEGYAEDIDAGFASHEPQDKSLEKAAATFGPTRPFVPLSDQLKSKLLLSLDGEGVPSSFLPELASGSLPFKQTSPYYQFNHRWLQPWEHFVPVSPTLDDLPDLIRWSRENDAGASAAAAAGARFVRERLRQSDVLTYLARALTRYAGMLRYSPRALSSAAPVPQPTAHCPCAASEAEPSEIVRILHASRVKGFALRAGGPPGSLLRGRGGGGALPTAHAPAELAQRRFWSGPDASDCPPEYAGWKAALRAQELYDCVKVSALGRHILARS
eukprot:tig00021037_g17448.t1